MCEVAYARPDRQFVITVRLPPGATAEQAVLQALQLGLRDSCPEIALESAVLGVFGKPVSAQHALRPGDRVEIYRPLAADPRIARRAREKKRR